MQSTGRPPGLSVGVTGASGLVGQALTASLAARGLRVTRIVRRRPAPGELWWDPARGEIDRAGLAGLDAVVHLAGENLASRRWTPKRKRELLESRVRATQLLARALASMPRRPAVLVSASAIGIYGDRGDEMLDETSSIGSDFLADLCRAWEAAAEPAAAAGVRVVHPRFGLILSPLGGALAKALLPFQLGAGARLGRGTQWMSWVSIGDAVDAIEWLLRRDDLRGPVNVVAPRPVTNAEYTRTLARVLSRPTLLAAPAPVLRLLLGELADAALLASQRVQPAVLQRTSFQFRHPTLEPALHHLLGC